MSIETSGERTLFQQDAYGEHLESDAAATAAFEHEALAGFQQVIDAAQLGE